MYGSLTKRVVCLYITIKYCQMTQLRQLKQIPESFSIMTVNITDRKITLLLRTVIIHLSAQRWHILLCCGFKHTPVFRVLKVAIVMIAEQTTLLCYAWYVSTTLSQLSVGERQVL